MLQITYEKKRSGKRKQEKKNILNNRLDTK